jgi:signal transduction histidine kinase
MSTQPLGPIIEHAIETAGHVIKERAIEISVASPPAPLYVHGDFERLAQIFANLLSNASKFSPNGSPILVSSEALRSEVVVRVRDKGIGIEPSMLDAIFELFHQADDSLGSNEGGLGVGLTIVKSLVEMHGGTIEAHSEGLGQGSEFVVRLPAPTA